MASSRNKLSIDDFVVGDSIRYKLVDNSKAPVTDEYIKFYKGTVIRKMENPPTLTVVLSEVMKHRPDGSNYFEKLPVTKEILINDIALDAHGMKLKPSVKPTNE